jgi:uncharacterized protein (DUF1800 family)
MKLQPSLRLMGLLAVCCLTLAACGGGGGGGGGVSSSSTPAATISDADAARFLTQATMGVTDADISSVQSLGYKGWIQQQLGLNASGSAQSFQSSAKAALLASNPAAFFNGTSYSNNYAFQQAVTAPDQLRQRVQLALSEIFVTSYQSGHQDGVGMGAYWDILGNDAFGNFRTLMNDVTLSPQMGHYLTYIGNQKENAATGQIPDENYARELMQLMTIGLWQLNQDGSRKLDLLGNPIPTYTHADIAGLAKVFTGISYYSPNPTNTTFFGGAKDPAAEYTPMIYYNSYHSISQKDFLGVTIPATTTANAAADVKTALDTIFNHPNVGPFIGRQLIQRLVTSNPSPGYISRVAAVFNDNGSGVRGDLSAVVTAILTDSEARTAPVDATYGKLREPLIRMTNLMRSFGATSQTGLWTIGDTSANTSLYQGVLDSPSVFNFWRPGYVPSNSKMGTAGLTVPEFQVVNEVSVATYVNTMASVINGGAGAVQTATSTRDIQIPFSNEVPLSTTPSQLVARINRLLFYGNMSAGLQQILTDNINSVAIPGGAATAAQITAAQTNRVRVAVTLAIASPEYLTQR